MENNDLISRSDAINAVSNLMPSLTTPDGTGSNDNEIISDQEMCVDALQALHKVPTFDAVPVVHGRWVDSPNIVECVVCSNCMSDNLSAQIIAPAPPYYKYCPCCGARMDGKEANQ